MSKYSQYSNEYDENNNEIYYKTSKGFECWKEYDENNRLIHYKHSFGNEWWRKYNKDNSLVYFKNSKGEKRWYKYDKDNKRISITYQEFKQIERTKLYLNNKKINRFEIMDI